MGATSAALAGDAEVEAAFENALEFQAAVVDAFVAGIASGRNWERTSRRS
jgi:hypothetical protein